MHKVISLYTGAGGLDLGLEAAGFSTAVAVEFNGPACKTLRANLSKSRSWDVVERSIHDVTSKEIMERAGVRLGEAALLVGGPPCQPFSKSAYWARRDTKRLDDPRADTLTAYLRVLRDLQPKAFLLENVFGLTYKGKDEGLRLLQKTIGKINKEVGTNYSFEWQVLNTANYGVPQIRERFFLVGIRDGTIFRFPDPTHEDPNATDDASNGNGKVQASLFEDFKGKGALKPWTTTWDAIGDLEDENHPNLAPTGKWGDLLSSIPEGENYLWHTDRKGGLPLFGWRRRYWSFLLKLAKDKPSWTIQAQPGAGIGPFHWKNRRLSAQEMMKIQTFPDGYVIEGGHTEIQRQLGNAVPSLMTEILGREIKKQALGDNSSNGKRLKLLPPTRTPVPPSEKLKPVHPKYHKSIGEHSPHPGTKVSSDKETRLIDTKKRLKF